MSLGVARSWPGQKSSDLFRTFQHDSKDFRDKGEEDERAWPGGNPEKILDEEQKRMQSSILKAVCVFLMGLVIMLAPGPGAAAQSENREARLVGTWRVQVTQVDCVTGAPLSPTPFPSLLTFAVGGTMAEDTTNPAFGPGQRGAGQGTWDHKGRHTYGARSVAFINYTTAPNPATHNPGFEAGEHTITQNTHV